MCSTASQCSIHKSMVIALQYCILLVPKPSCIRCAAGTGNIGGWCAVQIFSLLQLTIIADLGGICHKAPKGVSSRVEGPRRIWILIWQPLQHFSHVIVCLLNNVDVMVWVLSELVVTPSAGLFCSNSLSKGMQVAVCSRSLTSSEL